MVTQDQLRAGFRVVQAVADVIREVGRAPAGVVYAALASHGMSLASFDSIVRILENAGLVKREASCLVWTG